jgi:glycosyltransferase involved in cell wall biosynthesis
MAGKSGFPKGILSGKGPASRDGALLPGSALLLSIIVPVYNVAPYLRRCLGSIAVQTLPADSYEVITVDDKSTDGSLDICLEFAAQQRNFRVIPLSEHTPGGCGEPANTGMRAARGLYVGFVDSDDSVCPEMFAELLQNALRHNADISLCDQCRLDMASNRILPGPDTELFRDMESPAFQRRSDLEKRTHYLQLDCPPWLKIYRAAFLREQGLAFPEQAFFYEDIVFHWKCLLSASSIVHSGKKLVTHRVQRPGQTIAAGGEALLGVLPNFQEVKAFLVQKGWYEEYKYVFLRCAAKRYAWILPRLDRKLRREFRRQAAPLGRDIFLQDIPPYCCTNKIRMRTGIKHYLLLRGHSGLARFIPWIADIVVAIYNKWRVWLATE